MSNPPDPNGPYQPPVDPFESSPGTDPPGGGFGGFPGPSQPQSPQPPSPPASPSSPPTWVPPSAPASPPYPPASPPYAPASPPYAPASPAFGPASPPYGQPTPPYGAPPAGPYGPGGPGGPPPFGPGVPPSGPGGPPPKSRRGLLIIGVVAAAALILCAGGAITAFVLTQDGDRNGPDSPEAAAEQFLQAAYRDQDAAQVSALVCEESRDESATTEKINEIRQYQQELAEPTFTWSELAVSADGDLATVETTVTVITADEKTASLLFRLTVLDKGSNGWWVCDLETEPAGTGSAPPPAEDSGSEEDAGSGS